MTAVASTTALPTDLSSEFDSPLETLSTAATTPNVPVKMSNSRVADTNVFVINGEGAIVAQPSVIHFGGFEVDKPQKFKLKLINMGGTMTRIHVVKPTTPFFTSTTIAKSERGLPPGMSDTVEIKFTPTEWRYYYDCIRVQVQQGDNLLIPIHAYPVPGQVEIPPKMDFGRCPIGESITKTIPLKCNVPIDFDFTTQVTQASQYFQVTPERGRIPAKGSTSIRVTYTPQAYSTAECVFDFTLAGFNSKPKTCRVTGSCTFGLAKENRLKQLELENTTTTTITTTTNSTRTSTKPAPQTTRLKKSKRSTSTATTTDTVVDGVNVPKSLIGMASVNYIMNQPSAKLVTGIAVPLTDAVCEKDTSARAARDAAFLASLKAHVSTRQSNGETAPSAAEIAAIVDQQQTLLNAYNTCQSNDAETHRQLESSFVTQVDDTLFRTVRRVDGTGKPSSLIPKGIKVTFTAKSTDGWKYRVQVLHRFVQAARVIIIRNRADHRIAALKKYLAGDSDQPHVERVQPNPFLNVTADQIDAHQLTYTPPTNVFNDDISSWKPIDNTNKTKLKPDFSESGFWRLEVPREYLINGYSTEPHARELDDLTSPSLATLPPLF